MNEADLQLTRAVGFVLALNAALALQRWSPHARLRRQRPGNAGLWLINLLVIGVACGGCGFAVARWSAAHDIGLLNHLGAPLWVAAAATLLGLDLVSYGWHRANHRLPVLWRFHQVHHSDAAFTVSTAVRFHPGELLLALPVRLVAVIVLGAPAAAVAIFEVIFTLANFIEHGDIGLSRRLEQPLGQVFVTPALHRRHHSRRRSELDSNFGTVFSFWDRLAGTFGSSSSAVRVDTGLTDMRETPPLLRALLLPRWLHLPR
ncbi:MAG: sterol desaturase family protein [Candidatus Binatia bacterium]